MSEDTMNHGRYIGDRKMRLTGKPEGVVWLSLEPHPDSIETLVWDGKQWLPIKDAGPDLVRLYRYD